MMPEDRKSRLAMFLPSLHCGGAERMMVHLLCEMTDAGIPVDLILAKAEGQFLSDVPAGIRVIDFGTAHVRNAILPLARYLRSERPYGLLSRMCHANLAALIAVRMARVKTKIAIIEAINPSASRASGKFPRRLQTLTRWLYPRADAIVSVSAGVGHDLEQFLGLPSGRVRAIYNPVVNSTLIARCQAPSPHPWLTDGQSPVVISVGRLEPQKDHATLLRAFALVRQTRPIRMIIFGEGQERRRLEALRQELRLNADVDLPGVTDNAYAAMCRASLYVLSSRFEGLPNALIEALACGCPAVATDCPSGPDEILDGGRYGSLVAIEQPSAMATAISAALDHNWDRAALRRRGAEFSAEKSLAQYLDALDYRLPLADQVAINALAAA
jgi:glycosyltransferase involved in cell wall biosynthesis